MYLSPVFVELENLYHKYIVLNVPFNVYFQDCYPANCFKKWLCVGFILFLVLSCRVVRMYPGISISSQLPVDRRSVPSFADVFCLCIYKSRTPRREFSCLTYYPWPHVDGYNCCRLEATSPLLLQGEPEGLRLVDLYAVDPQCSPPTIIIKYL